MSERRFAVGLSFSAAQRPFVDQVAECLQLALGGTNAVLYDAYHEAEFSRSDLPSYLVELYLNHTELNVAFISEDYRNGNWTGLESDALMHLVVQKQKDRLMFFNFDASILSSMPAAGYIDCDNKVPTAVAKLILQRYRNLAASGDRERREADAVIGQQTSGSGTKWLNLPRVGVFVGRRDELARVLDSLRPEARTWGCVIAGPGGLGKTSLAIRAAESADSRTFDDMVFVSAKEKDLSPDGVRARVGARVSDALEILKEAGRQLGAGGRSWVPIRERVTEFLTSLRNRRVLLVFDNLETLLSDDRHLLLDTLRQLPNGCKAIVTTRVSFRAEACLIELGSLPDEDSHALLDEIGQVNPLLARASEAEKSQMVARCGGNPLILKWTLGQLGHGESRSIGDALRRLAVTDDQDDPIKFVFEGMADDLGDLQRRLLALLAIVGKAVDAGHLEELVGKAPGALFPTLRGLVSRLLVLTNADDSLFWLPPLAGHYVGRVLRDVVAKEEAVVAEYVVRLVTAHGFELYNRYAVIEQHWNIVQAAIPKLCSLPSDQLQTFCEASRHYLSFTGHWDERRVLSLAGEQAAVGEDDFRSAFRRAYDVGMVHYRRGETEGIVTASERVEAHASRLEDPREGLALGKRLRSLGLRNAEDFGDAITVGLESVSLFGSLGRTKDYACALNALGVTLRLVGDLRGAELYCSLGLTVAREVGHREYEADYVGNLADLPLDRGEWDVARRQAGEALRLSTAIGRLELIARNEFRLARIEEGAGDYDRAVGHAEAALRIYGELGMPHARDVMTFLSTILARPA